jgi:hypothetical protein
MSDNVTTTRRQRLEVLENQLREDGKVVARVRRTLLEIHDDHLYEEIGFKSWEDYLRRRVYDEFGIEMRQAKALVAHVQILDRLPEVCGTQHRDDLPVRVVKELGRLAPSSDGNPKHPDYGRLNRRDAARVVQKAAALAQETETKEVTQSIMRKVVDEELGVKRGKQPEPEPDPEPKPEPRSNFEERVREGTDAVKRLRKNAADLDDRTFAREAGGPAVAFTIDEHIEELEDALNFWRGRKHLLVPKVVRPAGGGDQAAPPPSRAHALLGDYNRLTLKQQNEFHRLLSDQNQDAIRRAEAKADRAKK